MAAVAVVGSPRVTSLSAASSEELLSSELPDIPEKQKAVPKALQVPKTKLKTKYSDMILDAVSILNERKGSSRQAIMKYLCENYEIDKENKGTVSKFKRSLVRLVDEGVLLNPSGRGATGSFKMAKQMRKTKVTKEDKTREDGELDSPPETDSTSKQPKPNTKPQTKAKALALKPKPNAKRTPLTGKSGLGPASVSSKKTQDVKKKKAKIIATSSDSEREAHLNDTEFKKAKAPSTTAGGKTNTSPKKTISKVTAKSSDIEKKSNHKSATTTSEGPLKKTRSKRNGAPALATENGAQDIPKKDATKGKAKLSQKSPTKASTQKSPKKAAPKKASSKKQAEAKS